MATAASGNAGVGTIKVVVGDVKVIGIDGVARQAMVGDKVFAKETIQTNANAIVQVQLENGRTLDLGRDSKIALDDDVLNVGQTPTTAPATGDIAALQAQIAAGADPSKVAEATAAGGAPGAGGAGADGSGGTPVTIDQANSTGLVTSGFGTSPAGIAFPDVPPALLPVVAPVVHVIVQVSGALAITPGTPSSPSTPSDLTVNAAGNAASVIEGSGGGSKVVNFVVTLDHVFAEDVTVTYRIDPGTATAGVDYFGNLTGTVIVHAGQLQSDPVPINIVKDNTVEADETFTIVITGATNATVDPAHSTAVVTIVNDDFLSKVTINDVTVNEPVNQQFQECNSEGPPSTTTATFTVTLDAPASGTVVVNFATANNTAITGGADPQNDYNPNSGSVTFAPGETSKTITVTVNGDAYFENSEQFFVNLTGVSGPAVIADGQGIGTILDNDKPTVEIFAIQPNAIEPLDPGDPGYSAYYTSAGQSATYGVQLSNPSAFDTVVTITVTAGGPNAIETVDVSSLQYFNGSVWVNVPANGQVTIPAGQTFVELQVNPAADTIYEGVENFNINLTSANSNSQALTITTGTQAGTIEDELRQTGDIPTVSITVDPCSVQEDGTPNLVYTVHLSNVSEYPTVVTYTLGGSATQDTDYTGPTGTITIPAGQLSATFEANPAPDTVVEGDETVTATILTATTNSVGLGGVGSAATGTIVDNDKLTFNITGDTTVNEGGEGHYTVSYTGATLAVGQTATVHVTTADGTAVSPADFNNLTDNGVSYNEGTGILTFTGGGATSVAFQVNVPTDNIVEGTENYTVNLTSPSANATLGTATAATNIVDLTPVIVVGSNSNDQGTTGTTHTVTPFSSPDNDGTITGRSGNDVLIGDTGGYTTGSYNLTFMIDVSGSVDNTELAQMKSAINTLLDKFVGVSSLHVDIGYFSASATILPTSYTTVAAAKAAINGIDGSGNTNYQAALTAINTMVGDDPAADHRLVYFLTDGDPTAGSWQTTATILTGMNGLSNISDAATLVNHIELNAIGIGLGDTSGSDTSATRLNAIDNTTDGYLPIASFATLDLGSLLVPVAVGADSIVGGDGNDIIFGDTPNTDLLAGNGGGYGLGGTHNGAGFDVLHHYTPVSAGTATDAQVQTWLSNPANAATLNVAGDPRGANDTLDGGAGNDTIFGQGGNDRIIGGAGNDIIYGGTGNDSMTGGTGSDTFRFSEALTAGNADRITDFTVGASAVDPAKDILNLHDVLPAAAQGQTTLGALSAYISVDTASSPGNTLIKVDADGAGGGAAVTVVTLEGVTSLTLAQLLTNNQIVT